MFLECPDLMDIQADLNTRCCSLVVQQFVHQVFGEVARSLDMVGLTSLLRMFPRNDSDPCIPRIQAVWDSSKK